MVVVVVVVVVMVVMVMGDWRLREKKSGLLPVDWRMTGEGRRVTSVRIVRARRYNDRGGKAGVDGWQGRGVCCVLWFGVMCRVVLCWAVLGSVGLGSRLSRVGLS